MTDKKKIRKTKTQHGTAFSSEIYLQRCWLNACCSFKKIAFVSKKQFLSRGKQKLTYKTERIVIIDCFIPRISAVAHKGHVDFLVASY